MNGTRRRPATPCDLALYGSGARRTVKGGTGSGEVNSRYSVTAEEGLEAAGFRITSKAWMDRYGEIWPEAKKRFIRELKRAALKRGTLAIVDNMGAVMPEPEYELPLDAAGDTAVYVLSRISGEGSDRRAVPGDILLTETEKRDILALEKKYSRFLLVLNVGGVVDLSPVMGVRNILLLSQLGSETGNILADVILGKSTPSGRLTTTWFAWEDHPDTGDFGDRYDTHYTEGVYVGYRWFDSAGKKPLFPFGYGLGYTRFELEAGEAAAEAGKITVGVTVKNTGERNGKETVQLYVTPPRGRLDKPYQALAAFEKTEELKPGEAQRLALSFDLRDLASYDMHIDNAMKLNEKLKVLENVYYFSQPCCSTEDVNGIQVPIRKETEILYRRSSRIMGAYRGKTAGGMVVDETWRPNDGLVNTLSAAYPLGQPHKNFDPDNIEKGTWNVFETVKGDHMALQGGFFRRRNIFPYYLDLLKMIDKL